MKCFLRGLLIVTLGACSVPSFGVAPEPSAKALDACATQTATGKACGGFCPVCDSGQACDSPSDCASGDCESNLCAAAAITASCSDGLVNGAESDTDCGGGTCPACPLKASCTRASDCESNLCDAGACAPMATCTDTQINGTETDTDCGGGTCPACVLGLRCTRATDCVSGLCKAGVCATPAADPSCSDNAKNGTETDTDCGGSCDPCAVDKRCSKGADCVNLVCSSVCQPAGCSDGVRNGAESDKDCGGGCASCAVGLVCKAGADCASLSCSSGHCIANTCSDGIKNGKETGKDCGGGGCGVCPAGQGCSGASDCDSLVCAANKTCSAATCSDGVKNGTESVTDCGKGCKGCTTGQFCNTAADCASATCTQSYCVPSSPSGGALDPSAWTATASDTASNSNVQWAFDGKLSSRWGSGTGQVPGMYFLLDMKKVQFFFSIDLNTQDQTEDFPTLFDVYLSTDGTFPSTPTLKSLMGSAPVTHIAFPQAVAARYVKLVLTAPAPNHISWWSIQELTIND